MRTKQRGRRTSTPSPAETWAEKLASATGDRREALLEVGRELGYIRAPTFSDQIRADVERARGASDITRAPESPGEGTGGDSGATSPPEPQSPSDRLRAVVISTKERAANTRGKL
jgi:hypothetical protein